MSRLLCVTTALAVLTTACRVQPAPEPLSPPPADPMEMRGYWAGEFTNSETGKTGTIVLVLRADKDSAYGEVVLAPPRAANLVAADSALHSTHASAPDLLTVTFRPVRGGMLAGGVEPYLLPDCACTVRTVFQASTKRDWIEGDYFTTGPSGLRQQGRWTAQRRMVAMR